MQGLDKRLTRAEAFGYGVGGFTIALMITALLIGFGYMMGESRAYDRGMRDGKELQKNVDELHILELRRDLENAKRQR